MHPVKGKTLSQWLGHRIAIDAEADRTIEQLSIDSRDCVDNSLFIALNGQARNGADFIEQAVAQGAIAVLQGMASSEATKVSVEHSSSGRSFIRIQLPMADNELAELAADFYDRPAEALAIVAITGTNGKTSVSHYAAQLSGLCGMPAGVIGTLGYGIEGHLRPTRNTTPDAVSIQRQLAELRSAGAQVIFLEASSHALVQGRLVAVPVDIAALTNITRDHLDYHGSLAAYANAKRSLFSTPGLSAAIFNDDDYYGSLWRHELTQLARDDRARDGAGEADRFAPELMTVSLLHAATACAHDIELMADGMSCTINVDGEQATQRLRLLGEFNLANVLTAAACVYAVMVNQLQHKRDEGRSSERLLSVESADCASRIVSHCGQLRAVPGRLQMVRMDSATSSVGEPRVVVDYAHTPDALQKTLTALKQHGFTSITTVFGCGGDRDKGKRALMGEIASLHSSKIILTSDNPRSEDPLSIIRDIREGTETGNAAVDIIEQREQAIAAAIESADKGALVLVAGKGHEDYQEYAGRRLPFSDLDEVRKVLERHASSSVSKSSAAHMPLQRQEKM
ncbi:UDP-N-acetylmuramoyl-L-alanyl-D-glutamate--2,6-diaminopimelate ligase [Allohahella marinimesophila]|uniref:UDP-N-acetylmuramoyl-L-alanyl-D-glutamate--2,6-diaminopimelate ligase n=2 Tax=Allohahella marinimesophila TaxID=1054972 RepID=A0ABP7NEY5_9GAMM